MENSEQEIDKMTSIDLVEKIADLLTEHGVSPEKRVKFFQTMNAKVGMLAIKQKDAELAMKCAATVILAQDQIDQMTTQPATAHTGCAQEKDRK